jgi:hypothetical protein
MAKRLAQLQIALGIWLVLSPWILGFYKFAPALWSSIIAGVISGLLGLWEMFGRDEEIQ